MVTLGRTALEEFWGKSPVGEMAGRGWHGGHGTSAFPRSFNMMGSEESRASVGGGAYH